MVKFDEASSIVDVIARHFNDSNHCDTIVWGPDGNSYRCFRFLLCASSPVFERMFDSDMVEGRSREVHIQEVDAQALEKVLKFLHSGQIEINEDNLYPLLAIGDEFEIQSVTNLCERYANDHLAINESNWFKLLTQGLMAAGRMDSILTRCQEFIFKNFVLIVTAKEFLDLDFEVVKGVAMGATSENASGNLDSETYYEVIKGLMGWLEVGENSEHGTELFDHLDLAVLSANELSDLCASEVMQKRPELSVSVVKALAAQPPTPRTPPSMHSRHISLTENDMPAVYETSRQGVWNEWVVPVRAWYYIRCRGANGAGGVDGSTVRGGHGAEVGGAFYLQQEDKIKILLGWTRRGGGASCAVIVPSKWRKKPQLVLVAGGGGAVGGNHSRGRNGKLHEGQSISDPKEVAGNHGCGEQITKRISMCSVCPSSLFLKGVCLWCDGGIKGGGGGYTVGKGSVMSGGEGGGSFVSSIGENVRRGHFSSALPSVSIWNGRELRDVCLSGRS
ncbi:hypothetical protein BSKO_13638 [Bryopsis sp. KO-2023]|nr:hypothetical protein BSKO_13638 [Bryopsis sp. KO-2023]